MRTLSIRAASLCLLLGVLTVIAYLALAWLIHFSIEPVRGVYSPEPAFSQHGEPVINYPGTILWLLLLVAYSALAAGLTQKLFDLSRSAFLVLCLAILIVSAAYVSVIHPTFLLAVMGLERWRAYAAFAERYSSFLEEIYAHWGLYRLRGRIVASQMILTMALCLVGALLNEKRRKS